MRDAEASGFGRVDVFGGLVLSRMVRSSHRFDTHAHSTFVLQRVDAGVIEFDCRGRCWRAAPGDLVLIDPDEAHTGRPFDGAPVSYRTLYPSRAALGAIVGEAGCGGLFDECVRSDPRLAGSFDRAFEALRHGRRSEAVDAAISFGGVLREVAPVTGRPARSEGGPDLDHARAIIRDSLPTGIAGDDLAARLGMHPVHLIRSFRARFGITPHQYELSLRVELARDALLRGCTVVAAACEAGFYDQAHMTKHFKRRFAVTPARFRRSLVL
ncbi:MAG: AraC family transcriptional regulator [Planctomycetota bacterium]